MEVSKIAPWATLAILAILVYVFFMNKPKDATANS